MLGMGCGELACMDPDGPGLEPGALGDALVEQGLTLGVHERAYERMYASVCMLCECMCGCMSE